MTMIIKLKMLLRNKSRTRMLPTYVHETVFDALRGGTHIDAVAVELMPASLFKILKINMLSDRKL